MEAARVAERDLRRSTDYQLDPRSRARTGRLRLYLNDVCNSVRATNIQLSRIAGASGLARLHMRSASIVLGGG